MMFDFKRNSYTCLLVWVCCLTVQNTASSEVLQNGGFETLDGIQCFGFNCELVPAEESRFGSFSVRTNGRQRSSQGPSQFITVEPGKDYRAQGWIKMLSDKTGLLGQNLNNFVDFQFTDNSHKYIRAALRPLVTAADGWVLLQGSFYVPPGGIKSTRFYYSGPEEGVDFVVDSASVTEVVSSDNWRNETDEVINRIRKSDVIVKVSTADGIDKSDVNIQVIQTRKSFPFGSQVNFHHYLDPAQQKYRDFMHTHFNWAVTGLSLKWKQLEKVQNHTYYERALDVVNGLRSHGIKVRGHNLVWSIEQFIPTWVTVLSGDQLRNAVRDHIQTTCNWTKGLLEHWDVNNENLHGQWYQEQLQDRDYDLELFRLTHQADPHAKLFLNEYNAVSQSTVTQAYLEQAQRFKAANVSLYGLGVQSHFHTDQEPNPTLIKENLDTLAQAGVPIWATELDVKVDDENKRADYYERALRALYGHPAVEGILFWGFWGSSMSAGEPGALVSGDDFHLTAAGRRVLDLLENQWMTDETQMLSQSGDHFTVRGFHGDYEVRVHYQGQVLDNLTQTFTLGKAVKTVNINVRI